MSAVPSTAMVLAAGLGTRMRPLTNDRPKALVEVGGRALIDHGLDRLVAAGVARAVVNVHAFADRLEAHLARRQDLEIVISDERDALRETGGGLKHARRLLGDAPVLVANIDAVWIEPESTGAGQPAIARLCAGYDPAREAARLLVTRTEAAIGLDAPGDFTLDPDARLAFRGEAPSAPFTYAGVHITDPAIVDGEPDAVFSLARVWRRLAAQGRLAGAPLHGVWMHVGDPTARDVAEAMLAERVA